jgi:hypothetical protein
MYQKEPLLIKIVCMELRFQTCLSQWLGFHVFEYVPLIELVADRTCGIPSRRAHSHDLLHVCLHDLFCWPACFSFFASMLSVMPGTECCSHPTDLLPGPKHEQWGLVRD